MQITAQQQYQEAELSEEVCKAANCKDPRDALKKLGATPEGQAKLRGLLKKTLPSAGNMMEKLLGAAVDDLGKRVQKLDEEVQHIFGVVQQHETRLQHLEVTLEMIRKKIDAVSEGRSERGSFTCLEAVERHPYGGW